MALWTTGSGNFRFIARIKLRIYKLLQQWGKYDKHLKRGSQQHQVFYGQIRWIASAFCNSKKRVFLFRQSFRRLLRKHMFTLRVQKVMICDFRSVWFALRFVVIVLFRDIIDYFASKIFLIFLDLVTCKNKEMSASFPRQKFHWPSRLPPPFFLSVMSCGPGWASALPPVN